MKEHRYENNATGRREFLKKVSMAAAIGIIGSPKTMGASAVEQPDRTGQAENEMPTIALGPYRISRLICGSNPILGYSYLGTHTDRQMKEYFTIGRVIDFLLKCEKAGITIHQSSSRLDYLPRLRERSSRLQNICLHSEREDLSINDVIEIAKPIAMVHHGGVTDRLFAEGKSGFVHDYVKSVKDRGLLAGVSAHNPDVIKQIASEDWEVDFFMTCFYFLTRKFDKPRSLPTLPVSNYQFLKDDPKTMTQVVRQVKQPCLAFKILGAGRLCSGQDEVRAAFKFAFENIKPTDGVIVGMFPWYFDEIGANVQYTKEFGKL